MENEEKELSEEMVNQNLKKEWIKPDMEEVEVLSGPGANNDGEIMTS